MPLNYALLESRNTCEKRMQEIFTAAPEKLPATATEEEKKEKQLDWEMRKKIEDILASRLHDAILQNLKTAHLHAAVDLAWDSSTITRRTIPLVMYAQKRIDADKCINELDDLKCKDQYVKQGRDGKKTIDLPKFTEVNINLVRSIITRRTAAQSARFTNLYPFFKYESRGTSEADKLKGDILSQRIDIMADQFGYRAAQIELIRDMLLYPHVVAFPTCKWEREVEWYDANEDKAVEFKANDKSEPRSRVKREGVPITIPHPSRVFYDMAHPITSINSDSGCEWFGFWDVIRYSQILESGDFFNRQDITYHPDATSWFYSYSSYFSQYYTTINPPMKSEQIASANDRKENMDKFTSQMRDSSVYMIHLYWKIKPNEWRMGNYPYPVWVHLIVANSRTVIAAEIMPDCPGFVFSYNESQQRLVNLSMAMDIMPFQDQLTNLYSQLLECAKRDLFGLAILNVDAFPKDNQDSQKLLEEFRAAMRSEDFYARISLLEVSLIKAKELGIDLANIFTVVRQPPNTNLQEIITAISQTIMLAERVMALSPQEQAQLSPRETSATEVQIIAGTTENIYQFISDSVDEGRAAMKRYIYNALMSLGTEDIRLPVISRYRPDVAKRIGFQVTDEEEAPPLMSNGMVRQFSVIGTKRNLVAEYIFSSRDGAERASNIQAAQTLTQMLGVLMQPAALAMLTRDKFADILNSIIRQSGAGVDVVIEPPPGTGAMPLMPDAPPQPPGPAVPTAVDPAIATAEIPRQ
jgi:hypothetical protein